MHISFVFSVPNSKLGDPRDTVVTNSLEGSRPDGRPDDEAVMGEAQAEGTARAGKVREGSLQGGRAGSQGGPPGKVEDS